MTREIKFRAWDKDKKEMFLVGNLLHKIGMSCSEWKCFGDYARQFRKAESCYIMQYTGLKDKNGKEIYEGDIVESNYDKYTIIWEDGAFCMDNKTSRYPMINNTKVQVIGNIYENPDLLPIQ